MGRPRFAIAFWNIAWGPSRPLALIVAHPHLRTAIAAHADLFVVRVAGLPGGVGLITDFEEIVILSEQRLHRDEVSARIPTVVLKPGIKRIDVLLFQQFWLRPRVFVHTDVQFAFTGETVNVDPNVGIFLDGYGEVVFGSGNELGVIVEEARNFELVGVVVAGVGDAVVGYPTRGNGEVFDFIVEANGVAIVFHFDVGPDFVGGGRSEGAGAIVSSKQRVAFPFCCRHGAGSLKAQHVVEPDFHGYFFALPKFTGTRHANFAVTFDIPVDVAIVGEQIGGNAIVGSGIFLELGQGQGRRRGGEGGENCPCQDEGAKGRIKGSNGYHVGYVA